MKTLLTAILFTGIALSNTTATTAPITIIVDSDGWSVANKKLTTQIALLKFLDSETKKDKNTQIVIQYSKSIKYKNIQDALDALGYAEYLNVKFAASNNG